MLTLCHVHCINRWQTRRGSLQKAGVSSAVQVDVDYRREERTALGVSNRIVLLLYTDWKHRTFQVACNEQVHCANAFRMGSSSPSFATKSCTCASITFQAGIITLSVDYNSYLLQNKITTMVTTLNISWQVLLQKIFFPLLCTINIKTYDWNRNCDLL